MTEYIPGYEQALAMLRRERERQGLRQVDIAERMGIKQSAVSQIECGQSDLRLSTLQRYHLAITGRSLRVSVFHPVAFIPASNRLDFAIAA